METHRQARPLSAAPVFSSASADINAATPRGCNTDWRPFTPFLAADSICSYHKRFGSAAYNCLDGCTWRPQGHPKNAEGGRKTTRPQPRSTTRGTNTNRRPFTRYLAADGICSYHKQFGNTAYHCLNECRWKPRRPPPTPLGTIAYSIKFWVKANVKRLHCNRWPLQYIHHTFFLTPTRVINCKKSIHVSLCPKFKDEITHEFVTSASM